MRRERKRRGVTLLEVLCVMAILVILLSVAAPAIETMYADIRQTAAADKVRTVFAEARAHAIEDGQAYRFAVQPGKDSYRVAPDRGEFWEGGGDAGPGDYVIESTLRDDEKKQRERVVFQVTQGGESTAGWVTVATFLPDGTCGDDAEVQLHSDGCRPVSFRVRALTGAVRVRTLSSKEGR